jgi:4-hydroxy-tetrahydrodipicolinate synthase
VSEARLAGIVPVALLPFQQDGQVDFDSLGRELDFLVDAGVSWVAFGFGSEVFRLTEHELDEVMQRASAHSRGKLDIVANVRAGSTRAAVLRAEAAAAAGARAVMMPLPPYTTVPQAELVTLYRAVVEASGLAIIVQDAPAMSGTELSLSALAAIVENVPDVLALKIETPVSAEKISLLTEAFGATVSVLGGNGGVDFYRELERGAVGTMPSATFADRFVHVWQSFVAGRREDARQAHHELLPFLTLGQRSLDTFLWVEKEALRRRGVIASSRLRDPSVEPTAALRAELETELDRLGEREGARTSAGAH